MQNFWPAIFFAIFGAIFGSAAGALIFRLNFDEKIFFDRSRCRSCGRQLRAKNLVPIFSFFFSRGRCAFCGAKIPQFFFIIEIFFAALFFIFAQKFFGQKIFFEKISLAIFAGILLFYDAKFFVVDRRISLPAIFSAAIFAIFRLDFFDFFSAAALGFSFFWLQNFFSRGKWVGDGDADFGAFFGFCVGLKNFFPAIFFAYFFGAIFGIFLIFFRDAGRKTPLPMGAFLMPALIFFLFDGEKFSAIFWKIFGI